MSYRVELAPAVLAEVRALPGHIRPQARQRFRELEDEPRPHGAKELRGKPGVYRLWLAGHWRIVYTIDDHIPLVRVVRVRRKEQIDYESLDNDDNGRQPADAGVYVRRGKTMSIAERNIAELVTGVQFTVDQTGKVTAVVLTPELWERIVELLEDSEDMRTARAALAALQAAGGDRARAGWLKWEDVEHEVG